MTTNKTPDSTLKPCPFCGDIPKKRNNARPYYEYEHSENECILGGMIFVSPDDWNHRHQTESDDNNE